MAWSLSSAGIRAAGEIAVGLLLGVWATVQTPCALAQAELPTPAVPSSSPQHLTVCEQRIFFSADNGVYGRELWSADSGGLCRMVLNAEMGPRGSNPRHFRCVGGGRLTFTAETAATGQELWVWSERDQAGGILRDFMQGAGSSEAGVLAVQRDAFLLAAKRGASMVFETLVFTNNESLLSPPVPPSALAPVGCPIGDTLFLVTSGDALWATDGTPESTVKLYESGTDKVVELTTPLRDRAVFRAWDPEHGRELWVTDGTPPGTHLLLDIFPGPSDSSIGQVTNVGDAVCFQADDGVHGLELWVTDGSGEGTLCLADIAPGSTSSDPHYFARAGAYVYFCANDGLNGTELYRTGLVPGDTVLAADLMPGPVGSQPWGLVQFQNRLFFCATSKQFGEEVFETDGTPQGTRPLKDVVPGPGHSGPDNVTNYHDTILYFTCNDLIHGEELWMSDGTGTETRLAADLWMSEKQHPQSLNPAGLTALGNAAIFCATEPQHGTELWISDGTLGGTHMIADLNPGPADSHPRELTPMSGYVYFTADAPSSGSELWRTDGSSQGTTIVADVRSGPEGSQPRLLTVLDDTLFFAADTGMGGPELWSCSLDSPIPTPGAGIMPGPKDRTIIDMFTLWDQLFFYAASGSGAISLWWYETQAQATHCILEPITPCSLDSLEDMPGPGETVGVEAAFAQGRWGKAHALLVAAVHPPHCEKQHTEPVILDGTAYFAGHSRVFGTELWCTNGTPAATRLVADVFPGSASSSPSLLLAADGRVFFAAEVPQSGRILCKSDGTRDGTSAVLPVRQNTGTTEPVVRVREALYLPPASLILVAATPFSPFEDIEPQRLDWGGGGYILSLGASLIEGDQTAAPRELTRVGDSVCFAADDPVYGSELWRLEPGTMLSRIISESGTP